MLTWGNRIVTPYREPHPITVRIIPPERPPAKQHEPSPSARGRNTLHRERAPSTAITYPPVPESVLDEWIARGALENLPDCAVANLPKLTPEQRERCARAVGALTAGTGPGFDLRPEDAARWADEVRRRQAPTVSGYQACPGTDRGRLGLSCMRSDARTVNQ